MGGSTIGAVHVSSFHSRYSARLHSWVLQCSEHDTALQEGDGPGVGGLAEEVFRRGGFDQLAVEQQCGPGRQPPRLVQVVRRQDDGRPAEIGRAHV